MSGRSPRGGSKSGTPKSETPKLFTPKTGTPRTGRRRTLRAIQVQPEFRNWTINHLIHLLGKETETEKEKEKGAQNQRQRSEQFLREYEEALFLLNGKKHDDYQHHLSCFLHFLLECLKTNTDVVGLLQPQNSGKERTSTNEKNQGQASVRTDIAQMIHELANVADGQTASLLADFDWDMHAIKIQSAEDAQKKREVELARLTPGPEEQEADQTLKSREAIFKDLGLDSKAKLVQCKKCKSWEIKFFIVQTKSSDEALTTKCLCTLCKTTWVQAS